MKSWNSTLSIAIVLFASSLGFSQAPSSPPKNEAKDPVIGVWEWTMSMGPMRKQVSMEIIERGGKLVALVVTPEGKKLESQDLVRKDDRIQLTVRNDEGGKSTTLTHDGKLKGDKIIGTAKMSGGPFDMSFKWDATRVVKKQSISR